MWKLLFFELLDWLGRLDIVATIECRLRIELSNVQTVEGTRG